MPSGRKTRVVLKDEEMAGEQRPEDCASKALFAS